MKLNEINSLKDLEMTSILTPIRMSQSVCAGMIESSCEISPHISMNGVRKNLDLIVDSETARPEYIQRFSTGSKKNHKRSNSTTSYKRYKNLYETEKLEKE